MTTDVTGNTIDVCTCVFHCVSPLSELVRSEWI